MRNVCVAIVVLLTSTACAYHSPTAPTPPPLDLTRPSTLHLSAAPGQGPAGGTATVTAIVSNIAGTPLASAQASYVTGASWPVDGGMLQIGPQAGSHIAADDWRSG